MDNLQVVDGVDVARPIDAIFINSPLKNYDLAPRLNDFTLPVLGLAYIATYAKHKGLNVGVIDAESRGLGVSKVASVVNQLRPRWIALNLLAPTYRHSTEILREVSQDIQVMLGGHQAKAMPREILTDVRIPRIDAMILGEGEYRAARILEDKDSSNLMPEVMWRATDGVIKQGTHNKGDAVQWLAPDVDALPFVDRRFLHNDPFISENGRLEANLVGSRGCPYDCSFCGAAKSANPDVTIRTRSPENLLSEMETLALERQVSAFRFVDDLFLASQSFMNKCLPVFHSERVGNRFVWDATGRINVLNKLTDASLDLLKRVGCREVALGIESGSARVLKYMGKHITPEMTLECVSRLTSAGINVKGYFILGFPTETVNELESTVRHIHDLWEATSSAPGNFRCSAFEFRPYPGTPEWNRLLQSGKYAAAQLLLYEHVDLTNNGNVQALLERDEFNFSVNLQFGEAPVALVRHYLSTIMTEQKQRLGLNGLQSRDHVQRGRIG